MLTAALFLLWAGIPKCLAQKVPDVKGEGFNGRPLLEVLRQLNDQRYKIVYSSAQITDEMTVGEVAEGLQGQELLKTLLSPFDLTIKSGPRGSLIVIKKPVVKSVMTLNGWLISESGTPLQGVTLSLRLLGESSNAPYTVQSDLNGRFEFSQLPQGDYVFLVQAPEYVDYRRVIREDSFQQKEQVVDLTVKLQRQSVETIVVTTNQYDISYAQSNDQKYMQQQDIERLSHLASDINRALAHVPGVSGGDFSARLHIRGGNSQENSFILDGMPLYNPFHLRESGSFFTIIDAFVIGGAELITGGATTEYGEHLSGVVNLTSKELEADTPNAIGMNFLHAKVRTGGELWTDNPDDNWLVSARHGFMRMLSAVSSVEFDNYNPEYRDFFAKVNKSIGEHTLLSWHSLLTEDKGSCSNACVNGFNGSDVSQYHWLLAETQWHDGLSSRTLLGHGELANTRNGSSFNEERVQLLDDNLDWSFALARQDWRYVLNDELMFKAGWEIRHQQADYQYNLLLIQPNAFLPPANNPVRVSSILDIDKEGDSYGAYFAPVARLSKHLTVEAGVRWDKQDYADDKQWSPRLNLDYLHPELGNIKASFGVFHQAQGIQQLLVENAQQDFVPAPRVNQFNLSYQNGFSEHSRYKFSVFQKSYEQLLPRMESQFGDDTFIYEGRPDRILLEPDSAKSKGLELSFSGEYENNFKWWLSYSYNRTQERIDGLWVNRQADQRHSLNAALDYQLSDRCHFSAAGNFHSGWRYTPVSINEEAFGVDPEQPALRFGERYSERYRNFFSVDIRTGCEYRWGRNRFRFFFEVLNLLNRENVVSVTDFYLTGGGPNTLPRLNSDDDSYIPRIPSLGIIWEF